LKEMIKNNLQTAHKPSASNTLTNVAAEEPATTANPKPLVGDSKKVHDVVIIGAGPAALTTSIYLTREDIETLLLEKAIIGGMSAITDWIDNYPGFPDGISGLELADKLRQQAERFGAIINVGEVVGVEKVKQHIKVKTTDNQFLAKSVLIASGSDYKKIGITGEKQYYARGVHYCATCDGAFYRGKKLVVVGGGNSAVQEALFLTRFAEHIDLLVRSTIKASDVLAKELAKHPKITTHLGITPQEIVGDSQKVQKVVATDSNGKKRDFITDGVFVFVGLKPNTMFLKDSAIELDSVGFVKTNHNMQTSVGGIFAAGDVRSGATMQIASAVGEGATVALRIRKYLES